MQMKCPNCQQEHSKTDDVLAQVIRSGAIAYVDALCPWCRLLYNLGLVLNSPFGAILCGIAVGALAIRIKESFD